MVDELQYVNALGNVGSWGGLIAYVFIKDLLPIIRGKNSNNKYLTKEDHNSTCYDRLEPIKKQLDKIEKTSAETHDAVLRMENHRDKRKEDKR